MIGYTFVSTLSIILCGIFTWSVIQWAFSTHHDTPLLNQKCSPVAQFFVSFTIQHDYYFIQKEFIVVSIVCCHLNSITCTNPPSLSPSSPHLPLPLLFLPLKYQYLVSLTSNIGYLCRGWIFLKQSPWHITPHLYLVLAYKLQA